MEFTDPVLGHSAPNTLWTTANVDEASPDVLSPLCWSVWGYGYERGRLRSQYDLGLLTEEENHPSEDPSHRAGFVFYGRQAANVDELRRILGRLPGVTPDDIERDWFGIYRDDPPPVEPMPEREPYITQCFQREQAHQHDRLLQLGTAQRTWWREEVFDTERSTSAPLERLVVARQRFTEAFYVHCFTRYFMPGPTVSIMTAAAESGAPDLASVVLSGCGEVEETAMADALWRVGQGELALAEFLRTYGFHGPNEGNVYARSWREDPERVAELAAQYARRRDLRRPRERVDAAVERRHEGEAALLAAVPKDRRDDLKATLRTLQALTRDLEVGKALYLMGLDGCRAAARDLGRDLVRRGRLRDVDDVFFLSIDELEQVDGETAPDPAGLIGYRRAARERYCRTRLPRVFTGMPEPIPAGADNGVGAPGKPLTGAASGGPPVTGRARVVADPTQEVDLEPGDILICQMTDPGWTALMALAAALVTDIGNASSHGAVVARELGITYVIGAGLATETIPDGATVIVDGTAGTVQVVP